MPAEQTILNFSKKPLESKLFFGQGKGLQRYDLTKYPELSSLYDKQRFQNWMPENTSLSEDKMAHNEYPEEVRFILRSNMQRQSMLDSDQGRGPALAFLPVCTDELAEANINEWVRYETLHSFSYTYIQRGLVPNPSAIFEEIPEISEIVSSAEDIASFYDPLIATNQGKSEVVWGSEEHNEQLILALFGVNSLEAISFVVSFVTNFALAERGYYMRVKDILALIMRDEMVHLTLGSFLIRTHLAEDEYAAYWWSIPENREKVVAIIMRAIAREKTWSKYLLSRGTILGLSEKYICDYLDWLGLRVLKLYGLTNKRIGPNPLPWMDKYYNSEKVRNAGQERGFTNYMLGAINQDVDISKLNSKYGLLL